MNVHDMLTKDEDPQGTSNHGGTPNDVTGMKDPAPGIIEDTVQGGQDAERRSELLKGTPWAFIEVEVQGVITTVSE